MYTINPTLALYTCLVDGKARLVLSSNSYEEPIGINDLSLVDALNILPRSFTKQFAFKLWDNNLALSKVVDDLWNFCCQENLIVSDDSILKTDREKLNVFERAGWLEAGLYHMGTRDHPFLNMSRQRAFQIDNGLMQTYTEQDEPPSVFQSFAATARVKLLKFEEISEPIKIGKPSPYSNESLSMLLDFPFGARQHLSKAIDNADDFLRLEMLKKAVPSGGGKHPVEAFVYINKNFSIERGLYHFNVRDHCLDRIKRMDLPTNILNNEQLKFDASDYSAVVFFTLRLERAMWRYREARSWRAVIFDLGHAVGMAEMIAQTLGYKSALIEHFVPSQIEHVLMLDAEEQPCLSVMGIY